MKYEDEIWELGSTHDLCYLWERLVSSGGFLYTGQRPSVSAKKRF